MTTIPIKHLSVIAQALKGEYRRYLDLEQSETSNGMHQEYLADLEVTMGFFKEYYNDKTKGVPGITEFDDL